MLYVENDRRHQSADLIRQIRELGYTCYWHLPPLYHPDNFYRNPANVFPGIVSIDMLCLAKQRYAQGRRHAAGDRAGRLALSELKIANGAY